MASRDRENYAQQLHQRLLQDDPLAPAEVVEAFLEELVRRLGARARAIQLPDDSVILDAATDALLTYVQKPATFDPTRSSLMTYLTMSAYGDLLNLLARESRRKRREIPFEDVEYSLPDGNSTVEGGEDQILERYGITTAKEKATLLRRVAQEFPDPRDRQLLDLMFQGERKTGAYSAVLGIQDHDYKEQQRMVKRHKDRITKRLQRLGGKLRGQQQDG